MERNFGAAWWTNREAGKFLRELRAIGVRDNVGELAGASATPGWRSVSWSRSFRRCSLGRNVLQLRCEGEGPVSSEGREREPLREWESVVERAIREAQERGEFDNLPGKGKPLRWDDEHVPPEWRMAHRILKNAGFAPAWIEDDKRIRQERKALRKLLDDFVAWYRQEVAALAGLPSAEAEARLAELDAARRQRIATYRERAARLNRKIDDFNLIVPIVRLQWHRVRIEEEVERFHYHLEKARREALGDT